MQSTYQKQKRLSAILIQALILSSCSGFFGGDSIEDKIQEERAASRHVVHKRGEGVPFYDAKGLSPNWDPKSDIVKIPTLNLTDQFGKTRHEDLFQDKITVVGFFFTSCSGICPTLIRNMKRVEKALKFYENVRYVVLSVDPDVDNPETLKAYAKTHHIDLKTWTLLTGKRETIYGLARDTFNSEAFKKADSKIPRVIHSEHFYILDSNARLRGIINGTRVAAPRDAKKIVSQLATKN